MTNIDVNNPNNRGAASPPKAPPPPPPPPPKDDDGKPVKPAIARSGVQTDDDAGKRSDMKLPENKGHGKVQAYQDTFGNEGYVKDGGDKQLLALMKRAAAAMPELAKGAFAEHLQSGHVRRDDIKALQNALQAKGYSVGDTGVDGLFGPLTHAGLSKLLEGAKPDFKPGSAPPAATGDGKTHDIGGPQPAVMRQGKYIGQGIAARFDAMVAAAKKDGVDLQIESGMRSRAEQQILWDRYGHDTNRVAAPGTSNHEKGNAIDFKDTPGAFAWLKAHSTTHGFHNYPPEPWHYSLDGR